ncbi:FAD-binding domain-containing protein [Lentithecium fluviatile CBS 122367]|uniref:FAD-binding domain-containing protein n=1 Tax=Lentithecium fluviatile CBS 122367 TaxID=1168545 RepID=A0A6G1JP96_9PLEO|nr:FAD-binding domain-containing protein [Lentithecium fluviatile CBS 122367]
MANMRLAVVASLLFGYLTQTTVADTCETVAGTTAIEIKYSPAAEYTQEQLNYWSTGCGALKPSCQLYPTTAAEVAAIVTILNSNNDSFVTKSGGHNANRGFASIEGGPLISTKKLNEVTFDAASMTVRVGPGNDWQDVHEALQDTGVTVVGGRIGEVGVGGYVVGGGLSFLSTQYAWAANNIVEYEVVLANASIVTASSTTNPDLYKALKGGGNSYGIVTTYTMVAHPQGQIWGGNYVFPGDKAPEMLAAIRDFTEYYPDEKAAVIVTAEVTAVGAVDIWTMFLFYDGPTPPAGVFDNFTAIGPIVDNTKTQSYYDLLTYNNFGVIKGSVYTITTETMPVPDVEVAEEVLGAVYDNWRNTTESVLAISGLIGSIAFQPIPKMLARKALERGGDLIDLDDEVDRIIIEFNYSYLFETDDAKMDAATQQLYRGTRDLVTQFTVSGKLPEAYLPLFANDGYYRQDYFGRLRTAEFARTIRDQYDPNGFFVGRTGGYKML